ncbi:MAG TPA: 50S ribosomal protein L30 [Candidatus Lokiarchaeia archaeon]
MSVVKSKEIKEEEFTPKLYFAIRVRGAIKIKHVIEDTLAMLRMHKINHGVLVYGNKSYMGMLNKCKDYIAFGEIDEKTLVRLLRNRGKVEGNQPLTDEHVKNLTNYKNINELAKGLMDGKIQYREKDIYKVKPVFRLHPPRKGYRGTIKRTYNAGGTLGFVGDYINKLIYKML